MFGEIGVESIGAVDTSAVVFDDFFESGKSAVVHVGGSFGDFAKGGGREFVFVGRVSGGFVAAEVVGAGEKAVVVELIVGEERAAVAVETIGSVAPGAGFVLGHKELETAFFLFGESVCAGGGLVELRVVGSKGEEVGFEGEGNGFGSDVGGEEGFDEFGSVLGI